MLRTAFALLSAAVLLGAALSARHVGAWRLRGWWPGVAHGCLGAAGLVALALALRAGVLAGPFAWDAAGLAGAALASGLGVAAIAWRRRRTPAGLPGGLVVLHATLGGIGYLILAGFALG